MGAPGREREAYRDQMNYCKDCKKAKSKGQIWFCEKHRQFITVFTIAYLKDKQCPDYERWKK